MKRVSAVLLTCALCLLTVPHASVSGQDASQAIFPFASDKARFVPDEILIQFKANAHQEQIDDAKAAIGAFARKRIREAATRGERNRGALELTKIYSGISVPEAIQYLQTLPSVQFAEPNWVYQHQTNSNDTYFINNSLWGMYGDTTTPPNQYGSQAAKAWAADQIGSASVYVGVIDEGIDYRHPDLAANIWNNPFDAADGIDNDGNGYVDDIHGFDFAAGDNTIYDPTPIDNTIDEHGTHVAGIIGATGGNGFGVAGVNWNVTIISGKFLSPSGGTTADAVEAINYFTDLKTRHNLNIVALNNSWGGGGYSQALHDAIIRLAKADILFIAAAGNGDLLGRAINNDATPNYPSNYNTTQSTSTESAASFDSVIAVASLTSSGAKSSFSNYGRATVDLGAPGSAVWSTTPNNTYSSFSGTSMATPHVTGAAALYRAMNPIAGALTIRTAILNSAINTQTSSLNGITVTGGRLNIGRFFGSVEPPPLSLPTAPTALTATATSTAQIVLRWTDNANNEDGFRIERCTGAGCTNFAEIATTSQNATTMTNNGLARNTAYTYRIRAYNAIGNSVYSNAASAKTPRK